MATAHWMIVFRHRDVVMAKTATSAAQFYIYRKLRGDRVWTVDESPDISAFEATSTYIILQQSTDWLGRSSLK